MQKRKSVFTSILCFSLSGILLIFYLATLYQALHRNTSDGYETFYIEQILQQWPGSRGTLTAKGDTFHFDSQTAAEGQIVAHFYRDPDDVYSPGHVYKVPEGWEYVEGVGYCMVGWKADVFFDVEPGEYEVTVTVYTENPGGELTILANGEQVAFAELGQGETCVTFPLATSEPPSGRWWFTFMLGGETEVPFQIREVAFA